MDRLVRFGKDVLNGWLNAEAFTLAAALAYYAIFAIAPLLLISIYIASLFFDRASAVEGTIRGGAVMKIAVTIAALLVMGMLAGCLDLDLSRTNGNQKTDDTTQAE